MLRFLQIVGTLVALASARPDIGLKLRQQQLLQQQQGYNYQPPQTSYGTPAFQQQSSNNQFQQTSQHQAPSGSYIPSPPNNGYLTPQINFNENSFSGGFSSTGAQGVQSLANQGSGTGFNSFSSQFGSTSSLGSLQGQQGQQAQVQKHVYFYEAPYEPEEPHFRQPIPVRQASKNYKIIFIKAPTQAPPTAPLIPAQPQNEEKTLVYVLVKKPDEQPEIHVPEPIPTQPSKPEVFFIKYKTKQEAENKIQGTLQGSGHEGVSANVVNNGAEFVSSIKDSIAHDGSSSSTSGQVLGTGGDFGSSSFNSQTGNTNSVSSILGGASSTSGSFGLSTGETGTSSQYGLPGQSGPYKK